jgi:hypothetical protein
MEISREEEEEELFICTKALKRAIDKASIYIHTQI